VADETFARRWKERGRQKMAEEDVPIGERPVGHLPGDWVRVEVGFFRHEMNLKEVFAAFEHEDHEPFEVTLRGRPEEVEPPAGGTKFSRVILTAIVPADAPPGVYHCRRLEAETFGGRRIAFDPSTEETWRKWHFLVREEPSVPPSF
jgi:hypothetical protein